MNSLLLLLYILCQIGLNTKWKTDDHKLTKTNLKFPKIFLVVDFPFL